MISPPPPQQHHQEQQKEADELVAQYARVVEQVLKPQLLNTEQRTSRIRQEIQDYQDLEQKLSTLSTHQQQQQQDDTLPISTNKLSTETTTTLVAADAITAPSSILADLGYQTVFCRATIGSNQKAGTMMASSLSSTVVFLFVHVGMGFHVQLTVPEAQNFVRKRIQFLQETKLGPEQTKLEELQGHIAHATDLLTQLQQQQQQHQ
jgi:hypothetical protein